jgi:hypothetical protein
MQFTKLFVGAVLAASATAAGAANFTSTYNVTLKPGDQLLTGTFGSQYTGSNMKGKTFEDFFNFTLPSVTSLDAGLQSVSTTVNKVKVAGLSFDSFDLYSGSDLVFSGDVGGFGNQSLASLSFGDLAAGSYTLKVDGKFTGTGGGSYSGNVNVSPVPEPESWSMIALGLAGVGVLARRRKLSA